MHCLQCCGGVARLDLARHNNRRSSGWLLLPRKIARVWGAGVVNERSHVRFATAVSAGEHHSVHRARRLSERAQATASTAKPSTPSHFRGCMQPHGGASGEHVACGTSKCRRRAPHQAAAADGPPPPPPPRRLRAARQSRGSSSCDRCRTNTHTHTTRRQQHSTAQHTDDARGRGLGQPT
jgi:hypothetical protein